MGILSILNATADPSTSPFTTEVSNFAQDDKLLDGGRKDGNNRSSALRLVGWQSGAIHVDAY
jgi:hypothetical protein